MALEGEGDSQKTDGEGESQNTDGEAQLDGSLSIARAKEGDSLSSVLLSS
ncbi:hypothetical protein Bca4012_064313 [Brassica carinata]